jgi:hypothetical protein
MGIKLARNREENIVGSKKRVGMLRPPNSVTRQQHEKTTDRLHGVTAQKTTT